ncbi:plasmid pRiA4b ORF-3 family protein [Neobacillus novalis]|uniref:Plasmid pRiA4b ORF-3 family protein n=1 Tax=Neobacillus novalis TaxID=220687 RepID=A0AA95SDE8_9BACI|nr:plasmid pRiA4b ORF-3 family protein [Neobacillus novalis]WHY87043.1 plasmid pRiA4b ORF-3 family protein [Neobacillus novalis]
MKKVEISLNRKKNATQLSFEEIVSATETKPLDKTKEATGNYSELESVNPASSETFPTSLVRDFDVFLDFIENHSVLLTKTKEYISRKYLHVLNERLSVQNEAATSYTEQDYYPYIHFFYFLSISGGLLEKSPATAGKIQLVVSERIRLYKELEDIEKYFFLLETFWVDVNWARLLDTHFYKLALPIQEVLAAFSAEQPKRHIFIGNNETIAEKNLAHRLYNLNHLQLYFEWIGFWKCEADQERINDYFRKNWYFAKSIALTSFGARMFPILLLERNLNIWNTAMRRENGEINPIPGTKLEDMMFGDVPQEIVDALYDVMDEDQSSQPFFQPFVDLFPNGEIKRTLPRNKKKFVDGIYTFKVSIAKTVWRKVVLSGKHTMDHLHEIILDSFNFDNDHLYSFFMDGKRWSDDCIVSPQDDYGHPNADKIQIGEVGFRSKQRFLFLYDYGDVWTFIVEVEHIDEMDSTAFRPYVKEGKGKPPEQYGYYEF